MHFLFKEIGIDYEYLELSGVHGGHQAVFILYQLLNNRLYTHRYILSTVLNIQTIRLALPNSVIFQRL